MDGMDQLWLSAPGLALRLWPEGAPGWQLNPAGAAWSERRHLAASHWDALAARLRDALALGGVPSGRGAVGQPAIALAWNAVPLPEGWLVWLDAEAPETERIAARLALVQEFGRMAVWEQDFASGERRWDARVFALLGFDPEQSVPSSELALQHVHPEDRAALLNDYTRFAQAAGRYETRYRLMLPGGPARAHDPGDDRRDGKRHPLARHGGLGGAMGAGS
jgi:PAS domain-containing protein